MPLIYQRLDLNAIRRTPPTLVIAKPAPHFGTEFGYTANMNCPFPRLVWEPDQPSFTPDYVFPVVGYVEQNYRVLAEFGPRSILGPVAPQP